MKALLHPILFLALLYCLSLSAGISEAKAAPHLKDYRWDKKIVYKDTRCLSASWSNYEGDTLIILYRKPWDSVIVSGKLNYLFTYRNGSVTSNMMQYLQNEVLYIDSLDQAGPPRKRRNYFDFMYFSDKVYLRTNTDNGSKLYYALGGADSVRLDYYENGQGPLSHYTTFKGWDDSTQKKYLPDGTLQSFAFDTLVKKLMIHCMKNYHANGRVKTIQYYYRDKPCLTWLFYSAKGVLQKKQEHTSYAALLKLPGEASAMIDMPEESFRHVEQSPEYPKGFDAFKEELLAIMRDLVYNSFKDPVGDYTIIYKITREGKTELVDIKGIAASSMVQTFKSRMSRLPLWKPAKKNRQAMELTYEMKLGVQQ